MTNQPIAIIGMGCRFPGGASTPNAFWELLRNGVDAITEVPADRWNWRMFYDANTQRPGKTYSRWGGFIKDIDKFDAQFFGISPREATRMDPQQRLLLEVAWEALENAGQVPDALAGSNTGVFVGISAHDYSDIHSVITEHHLGNAYTNLGGALSIAANRISYWFNFRGPSVAVDTACSSALVAIHMACQSIWNGDATLALAGGVNAILTPSLTIGFSKASMLSPDGRCKSFDAQANGYVRAEGAGMILLKPYAQALADGDPIEAVILSTVVNQDGRTPGISVPGADAQEAMLKRAYQQAGIAPESVQYVEAHGTGTPIGDPIEAKALGKVLSANRPAGNECLIGSVKSNIGHLEAGSGIAGVIKAVLCLKHREIPPTLHFNAPNPDIPFEALQLRVPQTLEDWPASPQSPPILGEMGGKPKLRVAGVNSFGFGGTNAHVVLQECPSTSFASGHGESAIRQARYASTEKQEALYPLASSSSFLIPLSARSESALQALVKQYDKFLTNDPEGKNVSLTDLAYSTRFHRSHHSHRLAMLVRNRKQLSNRLRAFANGENAPNTFYRQNTTEEPKLLMVYTGMGPQWWGMGRELMAQEPVFRQAIEECDTIFTRIAGWSLLDVWGADKKVSRMHETQVAQPANFMLQVAITVLWKSWGITPDAVMGHSVGEIAAAYVSGALSLEDALRVVYHRSRLQQRVAGQGTMLAAGLSQQDANKLLAKYDQVSLAAINSPSSVTLAGEALILQNIAAELEEKWIFNRFLDVEVAYHSYQMAPLEHELRRSLAHLQPRAAHLPLYSTVLGKQINGDELDTAYWWQNVREPIQLARTIQAIREDEYHLFLEVGPHPVLAHSIKESLQATGTKGELLSSLRRKKAEIPHMLASLAQLYTLGSSVNWKSITQEGSFIHLPTYAWQKERYWQESNASRQNRLGLAAHPFLNRELNLPHPAWEVELNEYLIPYLNEHVLQNTVVFPGAGYVEAALAMHKKVFDEEGCTLAEIEFHNFLAIDKQQIQFLHLSVQPERNSCAIYSRSQGDDAAWTHHASCRLLPGPMNTHDLIDIQAIQQRCSAPLSAADLYQTFERYGFDYGPSFQAVKQGWFGVGEILGKIEAVNDRHHLLHPAVLDSCFQTLVALLEKQHRNNATLSSSTEPFVPVLIEKVTFYASPKARQEIWAHGKLTESNIVEGREPNSFKGDILIFDENGQVMVDIRGIRGQAIPQEKKTSVEPWFYDFKWHLANQLTVPAEMSDTGDWLIFAEKGAFTGALLDQLASKGIDYTLISQRHNAVGMQNLMANIAKTLPSTILYLCRNALDHTSPPKTTEVVPTVIEETMPVVHLVQALAKQAADQPITLGIVTRGAEIVTTEDKINHLATAPLWGLGTLINNEHPHIRCKLVDLANRSNDFRGCSSGSKRTGITIDRYSEIESLLAEFLTRNQDSDVALRTEGRFVKQLASASVIFDEQNAETELVNTKNKPVTLEIGQVGQLDSLFYRESKRRAPKADEVEIQVCSVALNFKDLLKVLGQLSSNVTAGTFFEETFGMECSGTVVAVGEKVESIKVGNEVLAAAQSGFTSYVTIPATYVMPKPSSIPLEELPIWLGYLTSYYGLIDVARLQKGERVLIHNATGGVGLAAIEVARWVGAEIFATAGNDEKRAYLASLGIQHIFNSRSLAFADEIRTRTDNQGVDVVLSAMAGEALYQSFALLAPYGRYIEIGKKDIAENNALPMAAFNRNLTFAAIDFDRILKECPSLAQRLMSNVYQRFEAGDFQPMPVKLFPAAQASDAFRYFAQSKHIGKVVLNMQNQEVPVVPARKKSFHTEATYLITGGTGGLGLQIAKWLSAKGIRHLVLVSRRGAHTDEAKQAIAEMERQGTTILAAAVDVSDETQVAQLIDQINTTCPPLRGIFHGAMVLDDGFLVDMTRSRFEKVMAPKVAGALNLHIYTKEQPLDFFISFSSISSLIGNVGQANYVAANAFLDAFAHYRRAKGLPATTINLGVLSEVGVVARNEKVKQFFAGAGIRGFSTSEVLQALEEVIERNPIQIGLFDIDWQQWRKSNPSSMKSSRFKQFTHADDQERDQKQLLIAELSALSPDERLTFVATRVRERLAKVLQLPATKIDFHQSSNQLGIDSLMALELKHELDLEFGVEIPTMQILKGATVAQIARLLLDQMYKRQL